MEKRRGKFFKKQPVCMITYDLLFFDEVVFSFYNERERERERERGREKDVYDHHQVNKNSLASLSSSYVVFLTGLSG